MKIIVSHDVDHLYIKEHFKDTFLLGLFYKAVKNVIRGNISYKVFFKRFSYKLNRVKELHDFNKKAGVKETFFFGMRKGLNLSYQWEDTKPYIDYLLKEDVLIGMHGMGFHSFELLKEEKARLKTMLPKQYPLGIRNHYLRMNDNTLHYMDKNGFLFDSTYYNTEDSKYHFSDNVFLGGNIWEIPINIMDAGFVSNYINNPEGLKIKTIEKIKEAEEKGQPFFVINFHDLYFSDAYADYKQWYEWLIMFLSGKKYDFINFNEAVQILNNQRINEDSLHQ